ncbi:MAG: ATP-binding protein, partial [Terriglobales bacterium]
MDIPDVAAASPTPWFSDAAHQRAKQLLGAASGSLLAWPQTTAGHWFDRIELEDIARALLSEECRLLALLGPPGSGKSALLGRLGAQLAREGHVLLALKADLLPAHVASIRELDAWLDAPESLPVILERLAVEGPVTVLIDQIDALSELMDAHTERLFALIALIDRVLLSPRVNVVISCREFDAQHDLRLRNLIENDRTRKLKLSDIDWKSVEQFLRNKGFQPEMWPDAVRRILCRPNALKLFVKHFQPDAGRPVFDSYQSMLEQVLQESVIRRFSARALTALYAMANELASREELWVPRAVFEELFQEEIHQLQAAGW